MYVEQGRGYKHALFNLCLINVCISILYVNLKWQMVTFYHSEKFVQCAFCNKAKQGNTFKHRRCHRVSQWHPFRIALWDLGQ